MARAEQILTGNVGQVFELRQVGRDNKSVVDATIAHTPRKKIDGEWKDQETYWVRVTFWNQLAENVAEHWKPGDRVFVWGRTEVREGYTNKEGVEVPPRPYVIADVAGHDDSLFPSTQHRKSRDNSSDDTPRRSAREESKPAPKKSTPKPADEELDFDFGDDEGGDLPF